MPPARDTTTATGPEPLPWWLDLIDGMEHTDLGGPAMAGIRDATWWPLAGRLVGGGCARSVRPYPQASRRRFCIGDPDCGFGLVDADLADSAGGAATVDRACDHLAGDARRRARAAHRGRLVAQVDLRLLVMATVAEVAVFSNGSSGLQVTCRWIDLQTGPVPPCRAVPGCEYLDCSGWWSW